MSKLISSADLSKSIIAISKSGAKLDKMIQTAAVNCIGYSVLHGDIRPANELLAALPNGSRKTTLVAYMEKFGNIAYMERTSKTFEHFKVKGRTFDFDVVNATKWYDAKKEVVKSTYDALDELDALILRLQKRGKKEEVAHLDLTNKVALVVAQYRREVAEQAE